MRLKRSAAARYLPATDRINSALVACYSITHTAYMSITGDQRSDRYGALLTFS